PFSRWDAAGEMLDRAARIDPRGRASLESARMKRSSWWYLVIACVVAGCSHGGGSSGQIVTPGSTAAPPVQPPPPPPSPPPTQLPGYVPRTKFANVIARSGEGFLEDQGGQKILHLKGDAYTRGFQYGVLFGDEVDASRKAVVNFAAGKFSPALGILVGVVVG